jgi:hypothetical protein
MLASAVTDVGSKRNRDESSPHPFVDDDGRMTDTGGSEPIQKKQKVAPQSATVEPAVREHQMPVSDRTLAPKVRESSMSRLPQIPEEDLEMPVAEHEEATGQVEATFGEDHTESDEITNKEQV